MQPRLPAAKIALPPHFLQDMRDVDGVRLFADRRQVLAFHAFRLAQQGGVGIFQHGGGESAATGVVAFREVAQRIGGGKGESGTDCLFGEPADQSADQTAAKYFADQFHADLLKVLRGHAHTCRREKILDVATIEFKAVGFADAINHLHLQRNDRHRG